MTTYLGMPVRRAVAVAVAAAAVGVTLGLTVPTYGDRVAPCGMTVEVEDGVTTYLPASCATADELADRLDVIRANRGGSRFAP